MKIVAISGIVMYLVCLNYVNASFFISICILPIIIIIIII
jgi:hypothetical protein